MMHRFFWLVLSLVAIGLTVLLVNEILCLEGGGEVEEEEEEVRW